MSPDRTVLLSKAVSHALRHQPSAYGLQLDDAGWVSVEALLEGLRRRSRRWQGVRRVELEQMVEDNAKRRFEIAGDRIRALYGHSVEGRVAHEARQPPSVLFHGTSPRVLGDILAEGLRPMRRQYVHLSVDRASAITVGWRKDAHPVVLQVAAQEAYEAGVAFRPGNELVWLADQIPAHFLCVAPQPA
jgi:putative RNA 2'-phosphotransferase